MRNDWKGAAADGRGADDTTGCGPSAMPFTQRPGFLVRRMHQVTIAKFAASCGRFGVTPMQYSLLIALAVRKSCDQTTLADDLVLDRTTTAGVLRRLEGRGLIRREASKRDRRARQCRLTLKGARLLEALEPAAQANAARTLDPLSDGEKTLLLSLMARVVDADAASRMTQLTDADAATVECLRIDLPQST